MCVCVCVCVCMLVVCASSVLIVIIPSSPCQAISAYMGLLQWSWYGFLYLMGSGMDGSLEFQSLCQITTALSIFFSAYMYKYTYYRDRWSTYTGQK